MQLRFLLSQIFPGKNALRSFLEGVLISFCFWLPLPKSFAVTPWMLAAAVLVLIGVLVWICARGKNVFDMKYLGWRGLAFLVMGIVYSCVTLPADFRFAAPPAAIAIAGGAIILIRAVCVLRCRAAFDGTDQA